MNSLKVSESMSRQEVIQALRDFVKMCDSERPHALFAGYLADVLEQRDDQRMGSRQFAGFARGCLENLAHGDDGRGGLVDHPLSGNRTALVEIDLIEMATAFGYAGKQEFKDEVMADFSANSAQIRKLLRSQPEQ